MTPGVGCKLNLHIFYTHFNNQPVDTVAQQKKDTHWTYAGYCKTASK